MLTLLSQAAIFTMLYSDSLARFVFDGDENFSSANLPAVGESGYKIVTALSILAIPSMFSGFFFKDLFLGFGGFTFADSILLLPNNAHFFESDFLPAMTRIMPVCTSFFLIFLAIFGFDFITMRFSVFLTKLLSAIMLHLKFFLTLTVDFFALNWFYDACLNF